MAIDLDQEFFDTVSTDSMAWLENADLLKLSADLIFENLWMTYELYLKEQNRISNIDFVHSGQNGKRKELDVLEDKMQSYYRSYYLIIGYSFENIIKGLSLENNPGLSFNEIYNKLWSGYKSGHGISNICKVNCNSLTQRETILLEKLETYILWLGKYPVGKNLKTHNEASDKKFFDSNDKTEFDNLYLILKKLLVEKHDTK